METLTKLAPFLLRARVLEVGRERLAQVKKKLAYLLVTTDLSPNSLREVLTGYSCPVYQCLTAEDVERLFGFHNTKILGFHRGPLATSVLPDLRPFAVARPKTADMSPQNVQKRRDGKE